METINILHKELGISKSYIKIPNLLKKDRALAIVHREWIVSLLKNNGIPKFIHHESLTGYEVQSLLFHDKEFPLHWQKVLVQVVEKPNDSEQLISLPRSRISHSAHESGLSYPQLLHYISDTNYKNIWKQFYKKHIGDQVLNEAKENLIGNLASNEKNILYEVLKRFYSCKFISTNQVFKRCSTPTREFESEIHSNLLPALCIVEGSRNFLILFPAENLVTLKDCISFSPTVLSSDYTRPLFVIYQLLQVMKDSHDRGLVLGNLQLDDIYINNSLFIQVIPNFKDNIYKISNKKPENDYSCQSDHRLKLEQFKRLRKPTILGHLSDEYNLQTMCDKWISGQVTNFDYLMFLNKISGRCFGDPSCHFIMPWVTDFATRSNGNWRDLSKSKFRLNKGDRQLDLTFETSANSSQVPHHVSDILSEITYYVYLSRRTPRSILCKYVRSTWVPAEYPSSVQRLQEWTPDECIPEFFYDPTVFKSVHDDLPDLELPSWALTPEEFIEVHRETLESKHVSERLHHWIDLTFGYKLSGSAAVKSKNVCLQLVDSHTTLTNSGIVQLFSYPHPQKKTQIPFFEKVPPKLLLGKHIRKSKFSSVQPEKGAAISEDEGHSSGNGEDDFFGTKNSSPLVLSKLISRSKGSLLAPFQSSSDESTRVESIKSNTSINQAVNPVSCIALPKEYNPTALLGSVESVHKFFRKTFLCQKNSLPLSNKSLKSNVKQVVATKRIQEMQILGCLVVELFLQSKLRVIDTSDLEKRIKACSSFLTSDGLPRCVRPALILLLQTSKHPQAYPSVTNVGLPPPSAHQLLQPLLSSFLFPFPTLFPPIYSAVCNLYTCTKAINKCQLLNGFQSTVCNDLNYLKVKKFSVNCSDVWNEVLSAKNDQLIELILPYVKELFMNPSTSKPAVILLLNKISQCLGPNRTNKFLLEPLTNLYSSKCYNNCDNIYLYHKHFLRILIVRCGLKVFLENFIGPLIEATGRYKESSENGKHCGEENDAENDIDIALSPLEEDSSPDMDNAINAEASHHDGEVEIFFFEKEGTPPQIDETAIHGAEHLDLTLSSDLEQLSQEETETSPTKTQKDRSTDFISVTGITTQNNVVTSIECEVGSKNSETNFSHINHDSHGKAKSNFEKTEDLEFSELKVCELAKNSIVWLCHRLGPVLTSRHIIRNLLRMLSLSYTGQENLEQISFVESKEENLWKLSIVKWKVAGDKNVEMVLQALGEIADIYGEQIILVQYMTFMSDLISLSKRKFTPSLEGGIIGCLSLLNYIIPFINDNTLMDQLQDVILKTIIHPVVRLTSSTRFCFPSGHQGRYTLVSKLVDTMYVISLRIGAEMTRVHLAVPSLQRFFLAFDKARGITPYVDHVNESNKNSEDVGNTHSKSFADRYLEIRRDGTTNEWSIKDVPGQPISISHVNSHESFESSSPIETDKQDHLRSKAILELKSVFNAQLAHLSYLPFFRFLGDSAMENTVKNQALIRELCFQYEKVQAVKSREGPIQTYLSDYLKSEDISTPKGGSGSFGSNVAVVGNKIELQTVDIPVPTSGVNGISDSEVVNLVSRKNENTSRYLRGNWLAYWEHEIGRNEKDNRFNFKQIKLQVFSGHNSGVRIVHSLDNENSFISGSKDKTVKLWSLRSRGDGSAISSCQYTYNQHRKSLLSLAFMHSVGLIASCDSTIHIWDPFEGKTISVLENTKVAPINILKALNPPSVNLIAATTDATLKIIDTRLCSYVSEYKISLNSVGLVRSICVSPSGNWIATGQATGLLTILDLRTGMVLASWKGHEAEVLQLSAINDNVLLSSSLDQTVAAWNVSDGKFKFHMKGPAEPVHCLSVYNSEMITGTTANRIGVHTSIDSHASFSSTKLRSDAFKGILTSMTVLPLNRLLLLGADTGNITLLC